VARIQFAKGEKKWGHGKSGRRVPDVWIATTERRFHPGGWTGGFRVAIWRPLVNALFAAWGRASFCRNVPFPLSWRAGAYPFSSIFASPYFPAAIAPGPSRLCVVCPPADRRAGGTERYRGLTGARSERS
jgi:hypothetical protein